MKNGYAPGLRLLVSGAQNDGPTSLALLAVSNGLDSLVEAIVASRQNKATAELGQPVKKTGLGTGREPKGK